MFLNKSCTDFVKELSSSSPVPGGGGASAYAGAMGMALGMMVANLTLGKAKYEMVQDDIKRILGRAEPLRDDLLALVQEDAQVFEPLTKAFKLPRGNEKETKIRNSEVEKALIHACSVPLKIMKKALETMQIHESLVDIGNKMAISDIGVGVHLCKSALFGASLNVFINTKLMQNKDHAAGLNEQADSMLEKGEQMANEIYKQVEDFIR